ncbi:DUF2228 domain-containing protein [Streptomyces sp. 110]|uniref:DUF2228 domain-containing protein n=1 Tax=Streptomyces endocoffeicus TaxID=2898945 RepID=A0ABS1PQG1_9ACTN|nr:ADP-ribosylation family protein [Streptomyces endocoffeicus]MBL1114294.1 DUF2228 domain-containing protein [Streptomyces endocoffeicus]
MSEEWRMGDERRRQGGERWAAVEARVRREWGLQLPDSFCRFHVFLQGLGAAERRALTDMDVAPAGISDLFDDPGLSARPGIDARAHGRYYRDPPEFLTFLHGGSDGLHYGLWSDDGSACAGVASYSTHDGGDIDTSAHTPLEAIRVLIERHWRDLADDDGDADHLAARRHGLELLREALTGLETGDRDETGAGYVRAYDSAAGSADPARVATLDGAGALVTGETAPERPVHRAPGGFRFAQARYPLLDDPAGSTRLVADARRRLAHGDPAEALALGRDLHWASAGDPVREALANELLVGAYQALGRSSLAGIAQAHHDHRDLPNVTVLGSR